MQVRVQSIHFNADKKLLNFINKRADKLDRFFDRIINGEVYLRLQKAENEANKVVEFKVSLPGQQLFVKQRCHTFEEAFDLAVESLGRQLNKHKTKTKSNLSAHKEVVVTAFE